MRKPRYVISQNGYQYFVRHVLIVVQKDEDGLMVYKCDEHTGGPFNTLEEACACLREAVARDEDRTN